MKNFVNKLIQNILRATLLLGAIWLLFWTIEALSNLLNSMLP